MRHGYIICLLFNLFIFSSCYKGEKILLLKMPNNAVIREKYKVDILFKGLQIGKVRKDIELDNEYLLLEAVIDKHAAGRNYISAIFKEDILGNSYIELISDATSQNNIGSDTLVGLYTPLYHKVDTVTLSEFLKELGNFKIKLDSILDKQ